MNYNDKNTTVVRSGGIGFCGLLTIAFVVLKLCGVINWGWLWVLAPLWIPAALVVLFLIIFVIIAMILN